MFSKHIPIYVSRSEDQRSSIDESHKLGFFFFFNTHPKTKIGACVKKSVQWVEPQELNK
jgi:hypothetical protein